MYTINCNPGSPNTIFVQCVIVRVYIIQKEPAFLKQWLTSRANTQKNIKTLNPRIKHRHTIASFICYQHCCSIANHSFDYGYTYNAFSHIEKHPWLFLVCKEQLEVYIYFLKQKTSKQLGFLSKAVWDFESHKQPWHRSESQGGQRHRHLSGALLGGWVPRMGRGYVVHNYGDFVSSHKDRVVGPLPNAHFMAGKWGAHPNYLVTGMMLQVKSPVMSRVIYSSAFIGVSQL